MKKIIKWIGYLVLLAMIDVVLTTLVLSFKQEQSFWNSFTDIFRYVGLMVLLVKLVVEAPIEAPILILLDGKLTKIKCLLSLCTLRLSFGIGYSLLTGIAIVGGKNGNQIDPLAFIVITTSLMTPLIMYRWQPNKLLET
jgi:hypothetical protein